MDSERHTWVVLLQLRCTRKCEDGRTHSNSQQASKTSMHTAIAKAAAVRHVRIAEHMGCSDSLKPPPESGYQPGHQQRLGAEITKRSIAHLDTQRVLPRASRRGAGALYQCRCRYFGFMFVELQDPNFIQVRVVGAALRARRAREAVTATRLERRAVVGSLAKLL